MKISLCVTRVGWRQYRCPEKYESTYKVVERECDSFDLLVSSVNEARDSKMIRLIDGARSRNWMNHRSSDDIRVNDTQIKGRLVILHKLPCHGLSASLGDIVAENRVTPLNGLVSCDLKICQYPCSAEALGT